MNRRTDLIITREGHRDDKTEGGHKINGLLDCYGDLSYISSWYTDRYLPKPICVAS